MIKKEIILPTKRNANADIEDINIRVDLNEEKTLLREGDRNIILDINELFNKERNESNRYKIHGKIKMIFKNMYSGTTTYDPLLKNLYLIGNNVGSGGYLPYNEFAIIRNDVVREKINPETITGSTLDTYSPSTIIDGYTGHTTITTLDAPNHNWNVYLTYVYSGDTNHPMKYTLSNGVTYDFVSGDGIPFLIETGVTYTTLSSPVEHGLNIGEFLNINDEILVISHLGNEQYDSEKYVLNILNNDIPTGLTLTNNTVVLGKRCLDKNDITGSTSQYYIHKHKVLTNQSDSQIDKLGFESPIWEDEKKILFENALGDVNVIVEKNRMESIVYDFKNPFILSGLTNNMGYTPTDIYLLTVFRNGNGYFNYPPKVGWKFNFHDTWIDNHFSGSTSLETTITGTPFVSNFGTSGFTSGNTLNLNDEGLNGAFIEFNQNELKERIISESFHKLTIPVNVFDHGQDDNAVFSGSSINNPHGIYYQPLHKIKLRELSSYIESSDTNEVGNLPENTKFFENEGLWKWRDVYDHGFIDQEGNGTNYPFINNTHYIKYDVNLYLRNEKDFTNKNNGLKKFTENKIC